VAAALVSGVLLAATHRAESHFLQTTGDWVGHKRELCYRLYRGEQLESFAGSPTVKNPDIGDDLAWKAWIKQATDIWNGQHSSSNGSYQTGWSFRPCVEGEKADVEFRFDKDSAITRGHGGATTEDFHGTQIDHLTVWIRESFNWSQDPQGNIVANPETVQDKSGHASVPTGGRKNTGWSRNGDTTLDPVLVVAHELTHVMRLDHTKNEKGEQPVDTGSFEESIGLGTHSLTPSRSDVIALQQSYSDNGEHAVGTPGGSKGNLSLVTGGNWPTATGRDFTGHDELAVPMDDSVGLPGLNGTGLFGGLLSGYWPLVTFNDGTDLSVFARTGFIAGLGNTSSASVSGVSAVPRFSGDVSQSLRWRVPLLAGVSIPLNSFGDNPGGWSLELFAGADVDRTRVSISGTESGAPGGLRVAASGTFTSLDPAVGFGLQYGLTQIDNRKVSIGGSVTFDWTRPKTFVAQSPNFASETYQVAIGRQMETMFLFNLTIGLTRAYK
jgi:hypothetical protein